jgi:bacterioferritin
VAGCDSTTRQSCSTDLSATTVSREKLADLLNEDLEREYQAIMAYVVYSQVLKGAEYMNIAAQLESHAQQELRHALTISRQIDYLGKMPSAKPKPVKVSDKPREMLQFDLDNENSDPQLPHTHPPV